MPAKRKVCLPGYPELETEEGRRIYAERMRFLRELHEWASQSTCAEALGLAQPTYFQMESNRQRIRRRDLVTLAAMYGLPLEEAFPAGLGASDVTRVPPSLQGRLRVVAG